MASFTLSSLAVPAVLFNQSLLIFGSHYLFLSLDDWQYACTHNKLLFYTLCASSIFCYARDKSVRFCHKCNAVKPPRAHHCKRCQRCIPKMDHHCPWTSNCVAYRNFPHFIRFLAYGVAAMLYLEEMLVDRVIPIWHQRHMPSYLGPTASQLALLLFLLVVNSMTLFLMFVLLVRTIYSLGSNITNIEDWEIERHENLLKRARKTGGFVSGPNGVQVRIVKHEFPYDIGIYANIAQGMGSRNFFLWLLPFAPSLPLNAGAEFETNDFNDSSLSWPPPDPDRMPLGIQARTNEQPKYFAEGDFSERELQAFRERQRRDIQRYNKPNQYITQRKPVAAHPSHLIDPHQQEASASGSAWNGSFQQWRNAEGERLADFGVDEEAEADDEIPLAELIARRAKERLPKSQ